MTTAGGGGAALVSDEGAPAAAEFLEVVRQVPIVGRLAGLRRMPLRTRILTATGAVAHWVGEARGKPVSSMAFVAASCRR